jgi:hypothetical protein
MSVQQQLTTFALLGIPLGVILGLALSLVARRERGWGGYASFPRRATRLGHVAAVMLPLLAGFYALGLAEWGGDVSLAVTGASLWMAGSVALVALLFLVARWRKLVVLLPLPALSILGGGTLLGLAILAKGVFVT